MAAINSKSHVNSNSSNRDDVQDSPLPVLFLDGEALVVDKPAGLPVTPTKSGNDGVEWLAHDMRFGFKRPPVAVHRLDRDTSGCLLMARNSGAMKRFGAAFAEREVRKIYLGIVAGTPDEEAGKIDIPLDKTSTAALGWWMQPDQHGKMAQTRWQLIAQHDDNSLIAFVPITGRTHQIRAHAYFALGLPLLHDPVYRAGRNAKPDDTANVTRTMLHSWHLSFARHGKNDVHATAPMPRDFVNLGFDDDCLDQTLLVQLLGTQKDHG
ncbi:MAG: RNA pseudouridine synthase [Pseudomonadota bacterium]